jgi:O-antigen/teichoic acid export membrane protein
MSKPPTFRGAIAWSYVMLAGEKGIYALVTFILASILGPSDFGTVSMAMVYILFIQMFLEQGLTLALIQRKDLELAHLNSVFWMVMIAGTGLVGISLGLSGWWAKVNHLPVLAVVIRWLSVSILVEALTVVQKAILLRDMNFKSLSLRSNAAAAISGIVGIGMALGGFGVWALVVQKLSEDAAALVLLWKIGHWRPRLQFSLDHLKVLFGFSIASLFTKIAVFTNRYSIPLLIGLFFGPVTVGLYRLADKLVSTALDITTTPLHFVAFPEFCRLQADARELRRSVLACLRLGSILTIPALAGLAVVSGPLMATMGEKWMPAANALKILCVMGMVVTLTRFAEILLPALSRPKHLTILKWAECGATLTLLVAVSLALKGAPVNKQVVGIALTQFAIAILLFGPILVSLLTRLSGISIRTLLSVFTPSLLSAGGMVGVVVGLSMSPLLRDQKPTAVLSLEVLAGGVVGLAVMWLSNHQLRNEILLYVSKVARGVETASVGGALRVNTLSVADETGSAIVALGTRPVKERAS